MSEKEELAVFDSFVSYFSDLWRRSVGMDGETRCYLMCSPLFLASECCQIGTGAEMMAFPIFSSLPLSPHEIMCYCRMRPAHTT